MDEFFQKLMNDPSFLVFTALWGIVCGAATIYGVVLTIHLFRISRRIPRYTMRSFPVLQEITSKIPEIEIHYAGYGGAVNNVTVTRILFWNAGTTTIKKEDIAPAAPVVIHMKGDYKVLHAEAIKAHNPASRFEAAFNRRERTTIRISFDFLDHNQPCLVKIVHTGKTNADLELSGEVMGGGPFVLIPYYKFVNQTRRGYSPGARMMVVLATMIGKMRFGRFFGVLITLYGLFALCASLVKIRLFFSGLPRTEAWNTTLIECMIFGPMIYFFFLLGYLILFRLPPTLFDEFEAEV